MTCVTLAMFLTALGQTTVATALPSIVADLGGFDRYVWIATAYMVAATVAAPIAGGLSDLYGRKPFFIIGLLVFIAASALLGMSSSIDAVIAFRALQGIRFGPVKRGREGGLQTGPLHFPHGSDWAALRRLARRLRVRGPLRALPIKV